MIILICGDILGYFKDSVILKTKEKYMAYRLSTYVNNLECGLKEPELNTEASDFIRDNYKKLIKYTAKKLGIDTRYEDSTRADDLLTDIFIKVTEDEQDGCGYNANYFENGDNITIEQYIYSKINGYSKNTKYSKDYVEGGRPVSTLKTINTTINEDGKIESFEIVKETTYTGAVIAMSQALMPRDRDEERENATKRENEFNSAQMSAFDDEPPTSLIDEVDAVNSIRNQIDYCIKIGNKNDIDIRNMLKHIDEFSEILHSKEISNMVFKSIKEINDINAKFAQDLFDVILFRENNRQLFDKIILEF